MTFDMDVNTGVKPDKANPTKYVRSEKDCPSIASRGVDESFGCCPLKIDSKLSPAGD